MRFCQANSWNKICTNSERFGWPGGRYYLVPFELARPSCKMRGPARLIKGQAGGWLKNDPPRDTMWIDGLRMPPTREIESDDNSLGPRPCLPKRFFTQVPDESLCRWRTWRQSFGRKKSPPYPYIYTFRSRARARNWGEAQGDGAPLKCFITLWGGHSFQSFSLQGRGDGTFCIYFCH